MFEKFPINRSGEKIKTLKIKIFEIVPTYVLVRNKIYERFRRRRLHRDGLPCSYYVHTYIQWLSFKCTISMDRFGVVEEVRGGEGINSTGVCFWTGRSYRLIGYYGKRSARAGTF